MKKIYFAGAVSGGREFKNIYDEIISYLKKYYIVMADIIDSELNSKVEEYIYSLDCKLIAQADLLIAEVSIPSLGVGYNIGFAESKKVPVLCLYNTNSNKRLSSMISGNKRNNIVKYKNAKELVAILNNLNKYFK